MDIIINVTDGVPIYRQIVNQVKYLVASGLLLPGEELPPIRTLALQLRVTPNTIVTFSIVRGVASLRHHEYAAHGDWMLRGYALGMGAGTQVLTHLPWLVFVGGTPGEASRAVMMGLAWIINAIVAEFVIRTRLAGPAGVRPGQPRSVLVLTT
jgi:hypothetical protein